MRYALILGLVLLSVLLCAVPVSREQAEQAARNWTAVWAPQEFDASAASKVTALGDTSNPELYLIEYEDGFVVATGDDAARPVAGYGYNVPLGNYKENPAFWGYLQSLRQEVAELRQSRADNSETAAQWQAILNNEMLRDNTRAVVPLLTTRWNQNWPYNMLCPADPAGPGGHVYAGCVATAMAQVMKYWNWPVTGMGSHTYYASGYGSQSANFGQTTYQWADMPNIVHEPNQAVALLQYHCGVAVDMGYSPDGSGAYSNDVVTAWAQNFRYNPGVQLRAKQNYSTAAWEQLLREELDAIRPLYYHGFGNGGGHAFVCDGYQGTSYFHFNWGWGGSYDGYFYVSSLNPGSSFNNGQGAIFNAYPLNYSMSAVQLTLEAADCSVGEPLPLTISTYPLLPEWNVNSISFTVEFDEANMLYTGYDTAGTLLEGATVSATLLQPGRMAFGVNSGTSLTGGGNLIKLSFEPMIPGNFAFHLGDVLLNQTTLTLVQPALVTVGALVTEVQNSVLDLHNAMYVNYQEVASVPLSTTFVLPTWNVTGASFTLSYPPELVSWEGIDTEGCLASGAAIDISNDGSGTLDLNLDFNGLLAGGGALLKLNFRAIGNTGQVGLATLNLSGFSYNQTPVLNLQPGYIVLLPVTSNDENTAPAEPRFSWGPNPFRTSVGLELTLPKANQPASINIFNIKGQLVRSVYNAEVKGNNLKLNWDGTDQTGKTVPGGIYLARIKTEGFGKAVKLIRLK